MRALWCGCAVRECMAHGARTAEAVTVNAANMSSTTRRGVRMTRRTPKPWSTRATENKYLVRTYKQYYINVLWYI